ncbi:NAD(P)-dependent oxidoreductase [Sabulicella rubraurantiaca]|uniref:NAD(P)-dependent oxidoreductase n=1 Tax=Sabulicella rubraurantiaca TaxID=2811429 RepID=UPI001A97D32C|nr:NAD(P)-dependent oxidoreductase [Sabulicella rubraurantiaca]
MADQVIGFVGLGQMGRPMATRLLEAGHRLVVHDRVPEAVAALVAKGAEAAGSPREVADRADVVLVSLPTPAIVRDVAIGLGGVLEGQRARALVDFSTTGPRVAGEVHEAFAAAGRDVLDAPVSGGKSGAAAGTLAVMVSGPRARFDALEPVLKVMGRPFFCGEQPGAAQVMKLCNNLLAAATLVVSSEALAMGVKAGLDPSLMCEVINASSGRNSATQDKFPRAIIPRSFDFGFTTGLSHKDVRLCVEEAEAMGIPMVVGSAVRQMLAVTSAKHGPESDFTSVAKVLEDWAGVTIGGSKP